MEEKKMTISEYEKENSSLESDNSGTYNRRNVDNFKRLIVLAFILMFVIPVLLCLYLMIKINGLERKLDSLSDKIAAKTVTVGQITEDEEMLPDDVLYLEQDAYEDLDKNTAVGSEYLSLSDSSESGTTEAEEVTEEVMPEKEEPYSANSIFNSNGKKVYLTFDDGPSIYTGEILDILKENNVKATFFVVYNDDEELWPMYSRIAEEGHTLAMHSYTHVYKDIYSSLDSFKEDVSDIHDFLYEQTGVDCTYYRFPGGSSNSVSAVDIQELMQYLDDEGYTYFDWNSLSGDAVDAGLSAQELNNNILGYVRNNSGDSIVLMHDLETAYGTVEGLEELITTLKKEGYEICPIDEDTVPVQHVEYKND